MIELKVKIDTIKLADKISTAIDSNIENSEDLEAFLLLMTHEQKIEFSNLINDSVHGVVCHFDNLSGVMS